MIARASIRIGLVAGFLVMLTSCGSRGAAVEAPATSAAAAPDERADDIEEPAAPAAAPPSFTDAELDAMERSEIEAACVAGSTMACDRLGH